MKLKRLRRVRLVLARVSVACRIAFRPRQNAFATMPGFAAASCMGFPSDASKEGWRADMMMGLDRDGCLA